MVDDTTGEPYYTVEVGIAKEEIERLGARRLIPGMPAEVFVQTKERTPLSYLVKPFTEHLRRALREE